MGLQVNTLCLLAVRGVNTLHTSLHGCGKAKVLIFVGFIYQDGINAHIIEVLNIVGLTVEHFKCFHLGILSGHGLFLLVTLLTLAANGISKPGQLVFQLVDFLLGLLHNPTAAVRVGIAHLLQHQHLFLYLVLNKPHLTLFAVRDALKDTLRNNNHIPIVVLDFGVEIPSPFCCAVCLLNRQHLDTGIKFLGIFNKLPNGRILNNNHRFSRSAKPTHFHGRTDKSVGFAAAYFMCKQQRLCCATDYGLSLMRTQFNGMSCTTEILRYKPHGNAFGHIVIEHVIIDALNTLTHGWVTLHLRSCPLLEVLTYLVYLVGTGLRGFLVGDGLGTAIPFLVRLANGDGLVLHGGFNELRTHDGLVKQFTHNTHRTVLLFTNRVRCPHEPCATSRSEGNVNVGFLLHIFLVQLGVYP